MQMNEVQTLLLRRMKSLNRIEKTAHIDMWTDGFSLDDKGEDDMCEQDITQDDLEEEDNQKYEPDEEEEMAKYEMEEEPATTQENWDFIEPSLEDEGGIRQQHSINDGHDSSDANSDEEQAACTDIASLCGDQNTNTGSHDQSIPIGDDIQNPVYDLGEDKRFEHYMKIFSMSKYPVIDTIEVLPISSNIHASDGLKQGVDVRNYHRLNKNTSKDPTPRIRQRKKKVE